MAKKDHLLEPAERLYVIDGQTLTGIARELGVNEKSIRSWKAEAKRQGNDWDVKRQQYLKSRASTHEELYEFSREIMMTMRRLMAEDKEIPMSVASSFRSTVGAIAKMKDYEDAVRKADMDDDKPKGLTPEMARKIRSEVFGM